MNLDNFEEAFKTDTGSCRATCECGQTFYNPDQASWDFEDGELEELDKDPKATNIDYSVGYVEFEGSIYVRDCHCWHERAEKIMQFIDGHSHGIARYLNLEKQRKLREANNMPEVG